MTRWRSALAAVVLLTGALTALPATPALGAGVLWVGGSGCSDSGSGTKKVPYCTISAAAAVAVAGQIVRVSSGTYVETVVPASSGAPGLPVVYEAATKTTPVVTGGTFGFQLDGVSWVTVRGFTVRGTVSNGFYLKDGSNLDVTGNRVEQAGLRVQGLNAAGIYVDDTVDSAITGNTLVDNSASGIYLTGSTTRVHVSGNEAARNAFGWQRNANGIDVRAAGNSIVGNRAHHNEDSGIQLYPGADDNLVANNVSYQNKGFTTTLLANCTHPSTGDTSGCFTGDHGIDNLKVTGNRIVGNTVQGNGTSGINLEGLVAGTDSRTLITNNVSVDNAVDCPDGAGGTTTCPGTGGNIRVDATSVTGTVVERDVLWTRANGVVMAWGNLSYRSLDHVRAVSGQELTGREADPLLVNVTTGDLRLRGGSPAIDMADSAASGQQASDIDGRPRADDVSTPDEGTGSRTFDDAGAFEYPPVPGTPTATSLAGDRAVTLSWSVPPAGGSALARFTVYRGTSPTALTKRATLSATTTSNVDKPLTAWTRYYYQVTAANSFGESLPSPLVSAVPTGAPIAPATPVVSATTAPTRVTLSWDAPAENGSPLTGYTVYRGTSPAPTTVLTTLPAGATGYADTGLTNGTTYYYRVRAANAIGLSAYSTDVAAMPTSISLVGTATKAQTSGVTFASVTLPAGVVEGDLLVAWLGFTNAATDLTGMDGWTPLPWSPLVDAGQHTAAAYYKVAGPAEVNPTVSWTTTSKGTFAVAAYRGVDPADPVAASGGRECDRTAAEGLSTPTVDAAQPGSWAVALFASRSSTAAQKDMTFTVGPGLVERLDANNSAAASSPWVGVTLADSSGAVATGPHTYTATPSFIEAHHHSALLYLNSVRGTP